jgi:hypothetical protein
MLDESILYTIPMWAAGLVFLTALFIAVEAGYRAGLVQRKKWKDADSGGGGVVLTSLFAILGLVLAFTYASGVSRFDMRKAAILAETNAIGTAFLKADVIADPGRSELKQALYEYALTRSARLARESGAETLQDIVDRSLQKQTALWPAVRRAIAQDNPLPVEVALVSAITTVFDAHTTRYAVVVDRLPGIVIWLLFLVAAAALSVAGFNAGVQGRISRWRIGALTLVLTGVLIVILDFDRPQEGLVIVPQASIENLVAEMQRDLGVAPSSHGADMKGD